MPKKNRDYSLPFTPPGVRVSLVDPGSNLDRATQALTSAATAEQRAEAAAVREQQALLAPEIEKANAALSTLNEFLKANAEPLARLRELYAPHSMFDELRGKFYDGTGLFEAARVRTQTQIAALFSNISQTRDVLLTIEDRVKNLAPADIEPRVFAQEAQFPGILDQDGARPRIPTLVRLDVARTVKRVAGLPRSLQEAQLAVEAFAALVAKKEAAGGVKSEATIRDPDEMTMARAADPHRPLQTSYDSFDPIQR
jgi:hypothetical protein